MKRKIIIRIGIAVLAMTGLGVAYAEGVIGHAGTALSVVATTDEDKADDPGIPTGDDPWKEMDQLVKIYYNNDKGVTCTGTVNLIDDNNDQEKILERHPFSYSFFNGDMYYTLDSMEFITQQGYVLVADHRGKLISFSKGKQQLSPSGLFDIDQFKKLMQEQHVHAVVTQSGNEKILTVDSIQDQQIQGYRIYYNPQTYQVSKMLIGMLRFSPLDEEEDRVSPDPVAEKNMQKEETGTEDEQPAIETFSYYLEISYRDSHPVSLQNGRFNPLQKFLKIDKGQVSLQTDYSSYQFLNTNESEPQNQQPAADE